VFSRLRIGILVTGDELVAINEFPTEDKIRISNSYALSFAVSELHHTPVNYGMAKDEADVIKKQLQKMISDDNDIIITTGSVSVGKYDLIKDIFKDIGVEIKFWKANIKPGKPIVFGVYSSKGKRKIVFGLPGNPVSCLVNFHIFIKPAIQNLFHNTDLDFVYAELVNDVKKNDEKRHFMRGILYCDGQKIFVRSEFSQSSGNLVEMSRANCLIEIPEEKINPKRGEIYKCIKM
jgi:molybdopterin molybdotransferase